MRALVALMLLVATQRSHSKETIADYIKARDDVPAKTRKKFQAELKKRFEPETLKQTEEVAVPKQMLAAAIFMNLAPDKAVKAAWEAHRSAVQHVPPSIALHYQILALQNRQPRGRPIELALKFPDYYSEEIAPDLVADWEEALERGKIPDDSRQEAIDALEATRVKMRPLLLDKMRVLARLEREMKVAKGGRRAEIEHDAQELELELTKAFSKVARRPEVFDRRKRPFDRLRIQIEDMGLRPTDEDRLLDPDAPPPPRKPVPMELEATSTTTPDGDPLTEPDRPPPSGPLPDQTRPGDPDPVLEKGSGRTLGELIQAYRRRLERTIQPWIGTPYLWGATSRGTGADTSAFIRAVFAEAFAIDLPRVARDQFRVGTSVPVDKLKPGDLVFFDTFDAGRISHVGVFVGEGRFAHASLGKGVVYSRLDEKYFRRAYRGARRLLVYPE